MFFINESNNHLNVIIVNENNKPIKTGGDQLIINTIKQLVVIGKNTIHDNLLTTYVNKSSLCFLGMKAAELKAGTPVDFYMLAENEGFLVHDHLKNTIYLSRSLYQLTNYCLSIGFSIFGILQQSAISHQLAGKHIINNDFNIKKIKGDELSSDDLLIFDLYWSATEDQIDFEMIIKQDDFKTNKNHPLFTEYTGTAINIGKFRKVALNELDEDSRIPELFPELELNDCVVFTELFDDNALTILVPNIMSHAQYNALITEMRSIDRKQLSYSAVSKVGYGVQVDIELLEDYEALPHYEAKVTRITMSPDDFLFKTFLKV